MKICRRLFARLFAITMIVALGVGCAHVAVKETISLHQGEAIKDAEGVTLDGDRFAVPGHAAINREDVRSLQFQVKGRAAKQTAEVAGTQGLSAEASGLLERGHALAKQFDGVGGVILLDDGFFAYHAEGTMVYQYHFAGLVLKEEMQKWARLGLGFTEGRSRARLLYARSVAPDSTAQSLSPDAMEAGSPSEELQFFNPTRKMLSGVIPGVEVGCVVEYAYEVETYSPEDKRTFFPGFFFQGTEPVVLSRVQVEIPNGISFNYMTRNFPDPAKKEPRIEETGRVRRYTWMLEDGPPITPEPMMPPEEDLAPRMEEIHLKSFDEVFAFQRDLQLPRLQLTPEIEAKVKELTAADATTEQKLARLYAWVQENTRYISIKGSLAAGLTGHTAQETFTNRYGDCTDKAILFCTMNKAIGVESYPVILMTNDAGTGVTEIPTIDGNHCISEVILDGKRMYLDTTAQSYRYPYFRADDHDAVVTNSVRGDQKKIPVPPPSDNARLSRLDLTMNSNGDVTVKTRNTYNGTVEASVRQFWKRQREDNRAARMAEYVNSISPGAVLETFELSDLKDLSVPLVMTINYALPGHANRAKDLMYLRMPTLERDYPEVALETRRYPVQYMTTEERVLEINLTLPPGMKAKWLPPPLAISNPYLDYAATYTESGGVIQFRETFRRLQRTVPVSDYPAYRNALRSIAAFSRQEVFLIKK